MNSQGMLQPYIAAPIMEMGESGHHQSPSAFYRVQTPQSEQQGEMVRHSRKAEPRRYGGSVNTTSCRSIPFTTVLGTEGVSPQG